ncbi:MAG: VIT domain-containing protein [Chloroflexota bacterium]|nr:VIT domain-containing protein [Chloroflexota bacterium]
MKRTLFLLLILLLVGITGAAAQTPCPMPTPCPVDQPCPLPPDCMPPMPPIGGVFTNPEWLKITYHRVNVTIDNQIARTAVDMQFVNEGNGLAEGTFVFPLPLGAVVDELIMYINDIPIEAEILPADEARGIYDAIVRQYRDPALLEYVGTQAVQANVFPIPPGESRRITITYSQALTVDNGLIHYVYPLDVTRLTARRPVEQTSISVNVASDSALSNVYSPSHNIAIAWGEDERSFRVGFEASQFSPDQDFSLYYGVATGDDINLNLLTYRESAEGDGFFMLMVQPPQAVAQERIAPKDIVLVVDQSGSMDGVKWRQAQTAASYVLGNLNPSDRFNVVLFSTGWRLFSNQMEPASMGQSAADWVNTQEADGGTDINGALTTALGFADAERPLTVLFITDGLATEGEVDPAVILSNLEAAAGDNTRIFTFGVGDDVDTFLLDSIIRAHRGSGSYVRPNERIDEEVASLYNRISAPVLTDVQLTIDGVMIETLYPALPLPDLFAGNQLVIVGRYRGGAERATIRLDGTFAGQPQSIIMYNMRFQTQAGGDPFIARLWATRRIGDLMNTIRLHGENPELVDSIISLSIRYGIITPYTSFLITEEDILTQSGRNAAAQEINAQAAEAEASGSAAVDAADTFGSMEAAAAPAAMPTMAAFATPSPAGTMQPGGGGTGSTSPVAPPAVTSPIQTVGEKTFLLQDGVWTDTLYDPSTMTTQPVVFLSDAYFDLLATQPELAQYFAIGERVIVVWDGVAYEVTNG